MKVWILGFFAYFKASAALSISFCPALDNPQTWTFLIIFETSLTDSEDIYEQNDTIKTSPTIPDVIPEQEEVKFEEPRKKDLSEKELEKKQLLLQLFLQQK